MRSGQRQLASRSKQHWRGGAAVCGTVMKGFTRVPKSKCVVFPHVVRVVRVVRVVGKAKVLLLASNHLQRRKAHSLRQMELALAWVLAGEVAGGMAGDRPMYLWCARCTA